MQVRLCGPESPDSRTLSRQSQGVAHEPRSRCKALPCARWGHRHRLHETAPWMHALHNVSMWLAVSGDGCWLAGWLAATVVSSWLAHNPQAALSPPVDRGRRADWASPTRGFAERARQPRVTHNTWVVIKAAITGCWPVAGIRTRHPGNNRAQPCTHTLADSHGMKSLFLAR